MAATTDHRVDAEIATRLAAIAALAEGAAAPPRGDIAAACRRHHRPGVHGNACRPVTRRHDGLVPTTADDGAPIELRWYAKRDTAPGSAVVYAQGGGMVLGALDAYDTLLSLYVSLTGVPICRSTTASPPT